jgi:TP53 regulating kinase-like protein
MAATAAASAPPSRPLHVLPPPFTSSNLEVLTQGAEALVYKTTFLTPNTPCVLKYRPPKPYRHPTLDKRLTKARLLAEARILVRCRKDGVRVPAVVGGDYDAGWLLLEYIEGRTIRRVLDEWVEGVGRGKGGDGAAESVEKSAGEGQEEILSLMARIGRAVGSLHELDICHGDLTTSNLMLRTPNPQSTEQKPAGRQTVSSMREDAITAADASVAPASTPQPSSDLDGDIILIDFGLASQILRQNVEEDKAVDLYVLERAFAATHPSAESLFQEVLRAYGESYKDAKRVLKRLADVRLRGRKRTMIG